MGEHRPETPDPRSVRPPQRIYVPRAGRREGGDLQGWIIAVLSAPIIGGIVGIWAAVGGVGFLPGFLAGGAVGYVLVQGVVGGGSRLFKLWLQPSGTSTARKSEYSLAQSLVLRGQFEAAIDAYRQACAQSPDDPEPYLRMARLQRDHLGRYGEAIDCLKQVRSRKMLNQGEELLVTQEIIEMYTRKLGAPRKAIPELARIVDRFPDAPAAGWARRELAMLREALRRESAD